MIAAKDFKKYRGVVEQAVAALGRDDVGVGSIEVTGDDTLIVTFSRGTYVHTAHIPVGALGGQESANAAVNVALLGLSKRISQDVLSKASR
ncbi:MAG TPA: hypothetical protein VKV57_10865 [bacterium]|nr:hypothetical protein [bacterium]